MRRRLVVITASTMLAVAIAAPTNGDADPSVVVDAAAVPALTTQPEKPHVVRLSVIRPRRTITKRERFVPWIHPGPEGVKQVIAAEAARWHVSAAGLEQRAWCESRFNYWATNGQYEGIGQFASETFYRGMASIGTRKVVLREVRSRLVRSRVVRTLSDGSKAIGKGRLVRQRVIVVKHGMIPSNPPMTHVWAQARIMARAAAGLGAVHSSEWECAL